MATDREAQLLRAAYEAGITSPRELANFMAQVSAESNGLNRLNEGFRYTKGPDAVTASVKSAGREGPEALQSAWQEAMDGRPQQLAELMYGGRMGNDEPGDGYKYHGRGYIQLTGKNQYRDAGEALNLDLVNNPELAADPGNATRIAVWYWKENVQALAPQNVKDAGSIINTGEMGNTPNGLTHREAEFAKWERALTPQMMRNLADGTIGEAVTPTPDGNRSAPASASQGDFNDVMRVMLPPQNGIDPHLTSDFGPRSVSNGSSNHKGVDFNYEGGQTGINLRHPTVRSPVSGTVEMPANSAWNTVGIRDSEGNLHQVLHLDSRSVRNGQPIDAGDPIGTMGNTNDRDPNMAQHVHYQIRDTSGQLVNPETFWNGRTVEGQSRNGESQAAVSSAMADGVLRQRDRGPEVSALQETLNRLGYTGRDGQPLETGSGVYGPNTHHAVEEFQRRHGLADVDGVVGSRTRDALTNAATRPLLSEATHPNHRLYAEIARQLPAGTKPEVAANVTLQAMENGVTSADKLTRVDVRGSDVFVMGGTPGDRVRVDLQAPTPGMQQMSDYTREQAERPPQQTQQQPSQLPELQERNQRVMTA